MRLSVLNVFIEFFHKEVGPNPYEHAMNDASIGICLPIIPEDISDATSKKVFVQASAMQQAKRFAAKPSQKVGGMFFCIAKMFGIRSGKSLRDDSGER